MKCWHFVVTFADSRKKPRPSRKVFLSIIATKAFYMSTGTLWGRKRSFENNFVFFVFFRQGAVIFGPLPKSSNMIVETVLYVSIGTLWGKLFFFWTKKVCNYIMFAPSTNHIRVHGETLVASDYIFSAVLSNLPSTCPEEQFEGIFLREKFTNFNIFRKWLKKVRAFVKNFRTGLSKLLSTCPEVPFNYEKIWGEYKFLTFRILGEEFSTFGR